MPALEQEHLEAAGRGMPQRYLLAVDLHDGVSDRPAWLKSCRSHAHP